MFQLTAAIRNLSEVGGTRPQIINLNIMEELCTVAELHQSDGDLMMNLARIFRSVLELVTRLEVTNFQKIEKLVYSLYCFCFMHQGLCSWD